MNGTAQLLAKSVFLLLQCLICILFLQPLAASAEAVSYQYDVRHRLTGAAYGSWVAIAYTYDVAGNRLKQAVVSNTPQALFSAIPVSGTAPLSVIFKDESSGTVISRLWNFGDGGTSTEQTPSHTFQNAGTYTVSLTVSGSGTSDTLTKNSYITVQKAPFVDTDNDGIDDNWEITHFGNLITAAASSDFDMDGYSDKQEYLNSQNAETDPDGSPYDPKIKNASGGTGYQSSIAAVFAGSGLWIYNSVGATWMQISSANPENMIFSGSTLYADFGASYGIRKWDGTAWSQLSESNPENMVISGLILYVDFGASGLFKWDGTAWSKLSGNNPEYMVSSGSTLYVDFGILYGLYQWDGNAWSKLALVSPENMVISGSTLYVDFGIFYGLYQWDGTAWSKLALVSPENMVISGSTLYVDFGIFYGLYQWDGNAWSQVASADPENMMGSDSALYADFGALGLYKWDGNAWGQLSGSNPVIMAISN